MHLLAQLLLLMANVHRDTKQKPQPWTIDDVLPSPYGPTKAERQAAYAATLAEFAKRSKHRRVKR